MIDLRFPKCTFTSFNRVPIDDDDVAEEIKKIRNDFLTNEVNTRRSGAIETNIKMKKVMDAWIGTTIEDIFREWKIAVEHIKRERKKSQRLQVEEQKRLQDEKEAQLLMAKKEVSLARIECLWIVSKLIT